ncbi:MAG: transporter substrate-binding domain-containing protein [Deltaproteobacteria bacterium]|nr:transporter substrate-binding domain-containing protein [Deltaproteobacteria bacterium]
MSNRFVRAGLAPLRGGRRSLAMVATVAMVAVCAVGSAGGVAAAEEQPATTTAIKPPAELRVGISPNYPPIAFEEDGRIVGVEADLAEKLGKELPTKVTLVKTDWDELWPSLREGKIDVVMSGVSITERRGEKVRFTDPYLRVGQMVLVRKKDMSELNDPAAMNSAKRKIGVEKNTTGEAYARRHLDTATIVSFDSVDAGVAAVRSGAVDAFLHDAPTVWRVVGRPPKEDPELIGIYKPLTDEYLAWAVRKDEAMTLGVLLDAKIDEWTKNGELQAVIDRWIPVTKVSK